MHINLRQLQGLSQFRAFKISLNENNEVELFYKPFHSGDAQWKGYEGHAVNGINGYYIIIIILGIKIFKLYPEGSPDIIAPTPIPDKALQDLPAFFPSMQPEHKNWWQDYIANPILPSVEMSSGNFSSV